jgi:outer membrane immunogenic protein
MKRALGLLGATLLIAGPAVAADLGSRPFYKPAFTWTGCYIGGFAGGASGAGVNANELSSPSAGFYNVTGTPYSYRTDASAIAGGTVGCNWQPAGTQWVLGVEGEAGYLHSKGSVPDPNSAPFAFDTTDSTKIGDWYGVVAGRLGYAVGPWLIYAKGGAAFTHVSSSIIDTSTAPPGIAVINATGSSSPVSAAAGGGLEYALTDHWTVKGEYLWLGINPSFSVCGVGVGISTANYCSGHTVGNGMSTGKLGVNYKF